MKNELLNILSNKDQIKGLVSLNIEEDGLTLSYSFGFGVFTFSVIGWSKEYLQKQIEEEQHKLEDYINEDRSFRANTFNDYTFPNSDFFDLDSMLYDIEHEKDVRAGIDLTKLIIIPFYQYHLNKLTLNVW